MLEFRSTGGLSSNGKKLTGYAAIFNSEADLGGFVEVVRNGAFRKSLEGGTNIRALYHHQGDALLGTTRGGTLKLKEDANGLAFELFNDQIHHSTTVYATGAGSEQGDGHLKSTVPGYAQKQAGQQHLFQRQRQGRTKRY